MLWALTVFSFGLQRIDRLKSWNWKIWRKSVPWPAFASPWLSMTPRWSQSQVGVGRPQQVLWSGCRCGVPRGCGARRRYPGHSPRARSLGSVRLRVALVALNSSLLPQEVHPQRRWSLSWFRLAFLTLPFHCVRLLSFP